MQCFIGIAAPNSINKEAILDTLSSARSEFLALARLILARFNLDLTKHDTSRLGLDAQIELRFSLLDIDFSLGHAAAPQIDGFMLLTCRLGPLPTHSELEACAHLLAANFELSSTHLSAFALDDNEHAIYTHSCVVRTSDAEGVAILIEGFASLATRWRSNRLPSAHELSLPSRKAEAVFASV